MTTTERTIWSDYAAMIDMDSLDHPTPLGVRAEALTIAAQCIARVAYYAAEMYGPDSIEADNLRMVADRLESEAYNTDWNKDDSN